MYERGGPAGGRGVHDRKSLIGGAAGLRTGSVPANGHYDAGLRR